MDVVYLVRPGDDNEELRYSLRSLTNLPHGEVWIAGHKPAWVRGVRHIPTEQTGRKRLNALGNITAAVSHPEMPEQFALFNDDFYVCDPIEEIPTLHRGTIADAVRQIRRAGGNHTYVSGLVDTGTLLAEWGHTEAWCYSLHVPLVVETTVMVDVLERSAPRNPKGQLHLRTLYGNVAQIGGDRTDDCKVRPNRTGGQVGPFLSTSDASFPSARDRLERLFPNPSSYEVPNAARQAHPAALR